MNFIDTHCHLYLEEFNNDIEQVITRAKQAGISQFYLPAIDSEVINAMLLLEEKSPGVFMAMMGLHPCSVKDNYKAELKITEEWLQKRKFAAIGEIGLDFYWDKTFTSQQYDAFNIQMEWALIYNMPIVIHTRNAMRETIEAVKPFADKGLRGIFHCFSGNAAEAAAITEMRFYLGIGGVLTYKNSGLGKALENTELEKIVLETDSPYLAPAPYRGKRNESSYIKIIAAKLAQLKNVSIEEVAALTTLNAKKIFGS